MAYICVTIIEQKCWKGPADKKGLTLVPPLGGVFPSNLKHFVSFSHEGACPFCLYKICILYVNCSLKPRFFNVCEEISGDGGDWIGTRWRNAQRESFCIDLHPKNRTDLLTLANFKFRTDIFGLAPGNRRKRDGWYFGKVFDKIECAY